MEVSTCFVSCWPSLKECPLTWGSSYREDTGVILEAFNYPLFHFHHMVLISLKDQVCMKVKLLACFWMQWYCVCECVCAHKFLIGLFKLCGVLCSIIVYHSILQEQLWPGFEHATFLVTCVVLDHLRYKAILCSLAIESLRKHSISTVIAFCMGAGGMWINWMG